MRPASALRAFAPSTSIASCNPARIAIWDPKLRVRRTPRAAEEVQAGLTGADTWATEVVPNPNKDLDDLNRRLFDVYQKSLNDKKAANRPLVPATSCPPTPATSTS